LNYDHLFTSERITLLDTIAAEVKAGGKTYTMEEVSAYLEEKRADWVRKLVFSPELPYYRSRDQES